MPWTETNRMEQRVELVVRAMRGEESMTALCEEFGVSRRSGYKWLRRYREAGTIESLQDHSRRPRHSPERTSLAVAARVVELRQATGWGARKLGWQLRQSGIDVPEITIHRILQRHDLIRNEDRHRPATSRFEKSRPHELWQMDFKGEYSLAQGKCYPLSILDDYSRYAIGLYALRRTRGVGVTACLIESFREHGVPEQMLMDHGAPWWATTNGHGLTRLSVWLIEQGIELVYSGIGHPQTQGKVERFHRTLNEALRHHGLPTTFAGYKRRLHEFRQTYNHARPHEALGMHPPVQRYQRSPRDYQAHPAPWDYPVGANVHRLSTHGCLYYGGRYYFVCEALRHKQVEVQEINEKLWIKYRHMYVREIDLTTRRTRPVIRAAKK